MNLTVWTLNKILAYNIRNYFSEKIRQAFHELSAKQAIHMKCKAIVSLKSTKKKIKMSSAAAVISTLKVKM